MSNEQAAESVAVTERGQNLDVTERRLSAELEAPHAVVAEAFKRLPLSLMVADGWTYTKDDLGHLAIGALLEAGWVIVPRKVEHKGPRAQVITPSDGVVTREGQILAVALHAAEERELDLLAKVGRLERQLAHIDGDGCARG